MLHSASNSSASSQPIPADVPSLSPVQDLARVESKIDVRVLHHVNRNEQQRKTDFTETVMAVYDIVENKLYKGRNTNLEMYFRDHWKISRAQGTNPSFYPTHG